MRTRPDKAARPWTEAENAVFTAQWQSTMTVKEIARLHKRSANSIRTRANDLGITATRPNHEIRAEKTSRMKAVQATRAASTPDIVRNQDDRYVDRCIVAGGFWAFSERRTQRGEPVICLPLVAPDLRRAA